MKFPPSPPPARTSSTLRVRGRGCPQQVLHSGAAGPAVRLGSQGGGSEPLLNSLPRRLLSRDSGSSQPAGAGRSLPAVQVPLSKSIRLQRKQAEGVSSGALLPPQGSAGSSNQRTETAGQGPSLTECQGHLCRSPLISPWLQVLPQPNPALLHQALPEYQAPQERALHLPALLLVLQPHTPGAWLCL